MSFEFNAPAFTVIKSYQDDNGQRFIEGIASTTNLDLTDERMSGEVIAKMAARLVGKPLRSEHGKGWDDRLGEIIRADVVDDDNGNPALWIKAKLFDWSSKAKDLFNMLKGGEKIGLSVAGTVNPGGIVKEFVQKLGKWINIYKDVVPAEVSITDHPANLDTFALAVSKSFNDDPDIKNLKIKDTKMNKKLSSKKVSKEVAELIKANNGDAEGLEIQKDVKADVVVETPKVETVVETPKTEVVETPKTEVVETPKVEEVKVPETVETPKVEDVKKSSSDISSILDDIKSSLSKLKDSTSSSSSSSSDSDSSSSDSTPSSMGSLSSDSSKSSDSSTSGSGGSSPTTTTSSDSKSSDSSSSDSKGGNDPIATLKAVLAMLEGTKKSAPEKVEEVKKSDDEVAKKLQEVLAMVNEMKKSQEELSKKVDAIPNVKKSFAINKTFEPEVQKKVEVLADKIEKDPEITLGEFHKFKEFGIVPKKYEVSEETK